MDADATGSDRLPALPPPPTPDPLVAGVAWRPKEAEFGRIGAQSHGHPDTDTTRTDTDADADADADAHADAHAGAGADADTDADVDRHRHRHKQSKAMQPRSTVWCTQTCA